MTLFIDKSKIQGPPPGSFAANILRSIIVPYQPIVTSGGEYPPPAHPVSRPAHGPGIVIKLDGLGQLPSFANGVAPVATEDR